MNLAQLFLILRARQKTFFRTLLGVTAAVLLVSLIMPKNYTATTTLVLNYKGVDPVSGLVLPAQLVPGYMATQVDIINSKNVALQVVDSLKLADKPEFKKQFQDATDGKGDIRIWLADWLQKKLKIDPSRESSVLDISIKANNPEFASDVANAFATEYQKTTIQLRTEPLKKASTYFNQQIKTLGERLEAAQSKLSSYQQEKGIVNADSRVDVETMRLNELSTQLVAAQGQLMEAESRRNQSMGKGGSEAPDVISNPLIQNLKVALTQAEARLAQADRVFMPDHPEYQRVKAEVDKLRSELNAHMRATSNSIANNASIVKAREAEIRAALEAQKVKVLALNRARDELAVLTREVENAQHAYDAATQRFNQTSLEGQANQTDVVVLNPAATPMEPSSPKIMLNLLLSLFLGSMLGIGLVMIAEMLDRRVRSAGDLEDLLHAPVLGVLQAAMPPPQRRFGLPKLPLLPNLT